MKIELLIIYALLFSALLWWIFVGEYRYYQLDKLRQALFLIRRELFDEMHRLGYLEAPAYNMTRTTLNGMIRFAHQVSLVDLFVFYAIHGFSPDKTAANKYLKRLGAGLHDLPVEVSKVILAAHKEMHLALLRHIVKTSVLLGPIYILTFWSVRALKIVQRRTHNLVTSKSNRKRWAMLDAEANEIGCITNPV